MEEKTIGILTCGGDCPGLNGALRAIVKAGIGKYDYTFLGYKGGFSGLLKNEFVHLKESDVTGILDMGGTILGTSSQDLLFDAVRVDGSAAYNRSIVNTVDGSDSLESAKSDEKPGSELLKQYISTIKDNMEMQNMEALIVIGGDQTLAVANLLSEEGINIVVLPKSINNSVLLTDMTLGSATAVASATEEIDKLHSTAETQHRAIIVEVVGDETGWIATKAGIAGGADVILIPEIKYDIRKVARAILVRKNKGKNISIIVIAAGAKSVDCSEDNTKSVSEKLKNELAETIDIECDVVLLGKILRGGRPCPDDRVLATQEGVYAVEMVRNAEYGKAVCLRNDEITCERISHMIDGVKDVQTNSDLIDVAKGLGVSFGD